MRILTDCPDALGSFLDAARWERAAPVDLPPAQLALWTALDGGPSVSTTEAPRGAPEGFWNTAVIMRQAARSQYDALHQALGAGLELEGPVACLALGGDGFHGQRGRPWAAPPGNLYLTVAVSPRAPVARLVPALTMLPAVAVGDAVTAVAGKQLTQIKWVNDVLLDGRKVAGVLTATHVQGSTVDTAVLGLGVNLLNTPEVQATPFVPSVGCLREAGVQVSLGGLFWALLESLAVRYRRLLDSGASELLEAYRDAAAIIGRPVRIWEEGFDHDGPATTFPAPAAVGVVESIEADLGLRLAGQPKPVQSGRLAFESACQALGLPSI